MRFQAQRGANDILPIESFRWRRLEQTFRDLGAIYGYQEIRTPMFEDIDLFIRSSGETSDIVTKEMYDFRDKGDRHIALKPEGTAPAMRALIQHSLCPPGQTQRLYYITPIFRYGRPGRGRYRQSHQVGLELVGSPSPAADAEIIEMTVRFYQLLGIVDARVALNSIGRQEARARYREVVLGHFRGYLESLRTEDRAKSLQNPLRLLDTKDPAAADLAKSVPPILDYLEEGAKVRFAELQGLLDEAGVAYSVAPEVVRGLDYYTDTVFEVLSSQLGDQISLCGGGRYDDLIKELGGPSTPAVGVAMGIERALLALEESGRAGEDEAPEVYVVTATEDAASAARAIVRRLREAGVTTLADVDGRKMATQLKQADRAGVAKALILGTDELAKGTVILRDLATGDQTEFAMDRAVEAVRGAIH